MRNKQKETFGLHLMSLKERVFKNSSMKKAWVNVEEDSARGWPRLAGQVKSLLVQLTSLPICTFDATGVLQLDLSNLPEVSLERVPSGGLIEYRDLA